jgi:excinuclease UvrABC helicase subunit UvrB
VEIKMKETDSKKQRDAEFTREHTLTPQDFRKMILEKAERAKVYSQAVRKRETAQEQL